MLVYLLLAENTGSFKGDSLFYLSPFGSLFLFLGQNFLLMLIAVYSLASVLLLQEYYFLVIWSLSASLPPLYMSLSVLLQYLITTEASTFLTLFLLERRAPHIMLWTCRCFFSAGVNLKQFICSTCWILHYDLNVLFLLGQYLCFYVHHRMIDDRRCVSLDCPQMRTCWQQLAYSTTFNSNTDTLCHNSGLGALARQACHGIPILLTNGWVQWTHSLEWWMGPLYGIGDNGADLGVRPQACVIVEPRGWG